MDNVFAVVPSMPKIDGALLLNGLPTVEANVLHGFGDVVQYYFMDFHSEWNMVFNNTCVQEITTPYSTCSGAPTNVVASYTNVTNGLHTFTDYDFGGYECSGTVYPDIICDYQGNSCKAT